MTGASSADLLTDLTERRRLWPRWLALVPAALLLLYLAGTPVELPLSGRSFPIGPIDIAVGLAAVALLFAPASPVALGAGAPFLAAFLLWSFVSTFWSIDPSRTIGSSLTMVEAGVVYIVAQRGFAAMETPSITIALRVFLVILLLQMFGSLVSATTSLDATSAYFAFYQFKNSFEAPIGRSNHLAMYIEFILFYELVRARRGALWFAALAIIGLVTTFSRAGIALTGLAMLPLLSGLYGSKDTRKLTWGFALALAVAASLFLLSNIGQLLLQGGELLERTAESRLELWEAAWDAAKHSPFLGLGYGTFEAIGGHRDVHNILLELLCETGLIGLALFGVGICLMLMEAGRPALREAAAAEGKALKYATIVLVVHSLVEPFFFDRSMLWFAILVALAASLPARNSTPVPTPA